MVRRVIEIDREKCNGCGACADACQEGAIGMVDGKAVLLRDDYCDGLGTCLPRCPPAQSCAGRWTRLSAWNGCSAIRESISCPALCMRSTAFTTWAFIWAMRT